MWGVRANPGVAQRVKGRKGDKARCRICNVWGDEPPVHWGGLGLPFNHRELDVLYSSGEQVSVALVSLALRKLASHKSLFGGSDSIAN